MKKNSQIIWLIIFVAALVVTALSLFTNVFPETLSQIFSLAINILLPIWTFWAWRTTSRKFWLGLFCFCCLGLVLSLVTLGMTLFA